MNRRDALKSAVAGVAGLSVENIELVDSQKPFIAVLRVPRILGISECEDIHSSWKMMAKEAGWPDLTLVILDGGEDFEIIEDPRHVTS